MTIAIRPMKASEADEVAGFVRRLATDLALDVDPQLTGSKLRDAGDLVNVVVAETGGRLCGACLWLITYSTFRATRGIYVVDLFVDDEFRGRNVGERLLQSAVRAAVGRGAQFVKLEVDLTNAGAARFYERHGFTRKDDDRLFVLEQHGLNRLIEKGPGQ